mmetsp:Transcript_13516/g.36104  ORF Transcript_13516/g.36104 Transcript_13516/m.36104 type:complete len:212 (-) Transcript_13516:288-923(-)|eukprot:CAMPEP_0185183530 /NCGR_PEP_ID=MMETSP1140-20130426/2045_1 /TAXON_ID=298111 /ORGANISM="Pavlova sp., Strain CCMP459" /LENGTH=211 /DNA_ID=CAMNT_0027749551 /DNA_START=21 /DNA_END=656 /DNA_ORIENTATION=-
MVCFLCFPAVPPEAANAKGATGARHAAMLEKQRYPNQFAVSMLDAPGRKPLQFCGTCIFALCGCPACYYRQKVLESDGGNGIDDFVCFQGYIPPCCGCDPTTMCPGSQAGLILEGCCCPVMSLSIARMHVMDKKMLQPDPVDYQLIAFSNCMQLLSCVCDILSIFFEDFRECAEIIDCVADLITCSVAGCMGAQIECELAPTPTAYQMQRE